MRAERKQIARLAASAATASTSVNVKKMARQLKTPSSMPDRVGPMAGPNMMMSALSLMAALISTDGNTLSTTENIIDPERCPCPARGALPA